VTKEKAYDIGDQTFIQRTLVLGQVEQLLGVLQDMPLPAEATGANLVLAMAGRLPAALSVILTPASASDALEEKDLEAVSAHLARHCDLTTAIEVVEDFFDITPVSWVAGRIEALATKLNGQKPKPEAPSTVEGAPTGTPSSNSGSSSAPETSAAGGK